jgi:hypothetical protein
MKRKNGHFKHTCIQYSDIKYINQILIDLKGERDSSTIIIGVFDTLHSAMDRTFRQKNKIETVMLNCAMNQMDLTNIYRVFHPNSCRSHILKIATK